MKNKIHENRKFCYDIVESTHKKYLNKKGFNKSKYLEKRNCPICKNKKYRYLFKKRGGIYVCCKNCSMVYLNPVFTDKSLILYYKNLHDSQSVITKNEKRFYTKIYTKGLNAIEKFKKKGSLLDVGCSSGYFLDVAKKNKWNTSGIELNKKEAKISKKKHFVYEKEFHKIDNNKTYDAITMWDVFEHLKNPHLILQMIRKKLNKRGLFFIQIPNVKALAPRILQEKCNMFDGIEHVNLYDPNTIDLCARKNKFKIIHMESVISEVPVISNFLNYENPYFGKINSAKKILNVIDEKKLHKNFLGYKLQVVLQKN